MSLEIRMKRPLFYSIVFVLLIGVCGFVQGPTEQGCKSIVLDCIHEMASYSDLKKGKSYFVEMEQKITYNPKLSSQPQTLVKTVMAVQPGKMLYENEYVSMYVDEDEAFTVLHPQSKILQQKGIGKNYDQSEKIKRVAEIQDSLVRTGTVIFCRKAKDNPSLTELAIEPAPGVKKQLNLIRIRFKVDAQEKKIYEVVNVFGENSLKMREVTSYKEVNFDYQGKIFTKARNKIYDSKGNLKTAFRYFELIDVSKG